MKPALKSDETRSRILTSALELFRERGFEATTMRDVAARAGVATGAAYYYFSSKDAIVLAFYRHATNEMAPQLEQVLSESTDLKKRFAGIIEVKIRYFEPSRTLLSALAAHVDPAYPLSPFSEQTRDTRDSDIAVFERAIAGSHNNVPKDLEAVLPRLLWMYQMGIILFWIHDRSPAQKRTAALLRTSVPFVVRLIKISGLPLLSALRRQILEIYKIVAGDGDDGGSEPGG